MILEVVFGTLMALRGKVMQKARKGRQEREQPTGRTYVWLSGCRIGPAFRTDSWNMKSLWISWYTVYMYDINIVFFETRVKNSRIG